MREEPTWIVKINAPADKVWPLVSDLGRHAEWSTRPYYRKHPAIRQITVCEPMKRFEVVSSDGAASPSGWTDRYDLVEEGLSTTVVKTVSRPSAKGVGKLLHAIAFPLIVKPGVQKGMNTLKAKAEDCGCRKG
jgi:hypothetical protein